jgi:hypothetical protein
MVALGEDVTISISACAEPDIQPQLKLSKKQQQNIRSMVTMKPFSFRLRSSLQYQQTCLCCATDRAFWQEFDVL